MAITQPGDVTVIAPIAVQNDANYVARAESILGGFVALPSGSGPPTAARIPLNARRIGTFAYTPTDGKWWQLVGGTADANWVERPIIATVLSVFGRTGAVVAAAGDYTSTQITNASAVTGATVTAALNTLNSALATAGAVSSVFGRTGAVVAVLNDYTSSLIQNLATVTGGGSTVTSALNALQAQISAAVTGVSSWNSRTGAVSPVSGDYAASQVTNDSTVTGTGVAAALNTLKASITALVTGVSSVYGRTGAVVAIAGDYAASKINNDSSTVTGTHVSDALDALKALIGGLIGLGAGAQAGDAVVYAGSGVFSTSNQLGGGSAYVKPIIISVDSVAGTIPYIFDVRDAGSTVLKVSSSPHQLVATVSSIQMVGVSLQRIFSNQALQVQAGAGSLGYLDLAGADVTSGAGGDAWIHGGNAGGGGTSGNVAIAGLASNVPIGSWHGMQGGSWIGEAAAVPTGSASVGFFLYVDPADHKLKARGPSGTVTVIANP